MSGGIKVDTKHKELICPRDHADMKQDRRGEAYIDTCPKCAGTFFDQGEMFAALGAKADPSYWDRPETMGFLTDAPIHCPRCDGHMQLQTLAYDGTKIEIDRCGHCLGIWLDPGEAERIMALGEKMLPHIDRERAAAQADLASRTSVASRSSRIRRAASSR